MSVYVLLSVLLYVSCGDTMDIPKDLVIGFATASYQIEGGWNEDGKGENVWDNFCHTKPDMIRDGSNGDIAADSYHKYKDDVQLLKSIGAQSYRFSLSWSRILPSGDISVINQPGVDYYNNLIDELVANGIQPMVTLFHWDLPQPLQDLGGWPNPVLIDYFYDYAKLAFTLYGDRVKTWITFNEPLETCQHHYGATYGAPALNLGVIGSYLAAHTVIKAHAKVYHLYNDEFRSVQKGKISITLNSIWVEPKTQSTQDVAAANRAIQFQLGWFAHPIFSKDGDYPSVMKENVQKNSKVEGRARSRLPEFTKEEVEYIKGTYDFFGLNHYTSMMGEHPGSDFNPPIPSWYRDGNVHTYFDPSWPSSPTTKWLKIVPWGFRKLLKWIKDEYNNPPIFVAENGYGDGGELEDDGRIYYYQGYLGALLKAIHDDKCNITGYTAWSLMDNFEWRSGYTEKFGIVQVDFNDPKRPRKLKKSAAFFKQILATRTLPENNDKEEL